MSVIAEKVIAAFESLPTEEKNAVANEILRRLPQFNRSPQTSGPTGDPPAATPESELSAMAADPEIRRELSCID